MYYFHYILIASLGSAQSLIERQTEALVGESNSATQPSAIYPLPEIQIKLENGSYLHVEPNSPVVLSPQLKSVEMICTADYPVKWEFLNNNKTIPFFDVIYRRLIRNVSEFSNPKRNRFMSLLKPKGLLESQSGKYLCRHYNEKLSNNTYAVSSYFDVFIPGNNTFNTISSVKFIKKNDSEVHVSCPVTDPKLHVRLYKLNERHFMKTGQLSWKPIYANYEPTDGFRLLAGLGRELPGTYNCTADNGASLILEVADVSQKELYLSSSLSTSLNESCWENSKLVRYLASQKIECFCKDSYGLFVNDGDYKYENRQANCSMDTVSEILERCEDWRLTEFFMNQEKSRDICFREKLTLNEDKDKSGSRPTLKVNGKIISDGNDRLNITVLNITYNGFVNWAGDFMLAICRSEVCRVELSDDGTRRSTDSSPMNILEYLETEPSKTQYFPMAHYQAKWNDVQINGTIRAVYVFQAHSLSYAWFPYATADIEWAGRSPLPDLGQKDSSETLMSESSSSAATSTASIFYSVDIAQSNYGFFLYIIILLLLNML